MRPSTLHTLPRPLIRPPPGVLTQFAIVIGIMITQIMGLQLATPTRWRTVLFFSAALAAAQFVLSGGMVESPTWLDRNGLLVEKDKVVRRIWRSAQVTRSVDSELFLWRGCETGLRRVF